MNKNKILISGLVCMICSVCAMESPSTILERPESTTPLADEDADLLRSTSGSKGRRNGFDGLLSHKRERSTYMDSTDTLPILSNISGKPFVLGSPREMLLKTHERSGRQKIEKEEMLELLGLITTINRVAAKQ